MNDSPIPSDQGAEAGAAPPGDYVTISRAALDTLRKLAERSAAAGPDGPAAPESPRVVGRDGPREDEPREPRPRRPASDPDPAAPGVESHLARELALRDERFFELEQKFKAAVRDRELATALAGRPLVAGAAAQLIKLWRDDFDAHEDGGQYKVSARDGRPVARVVSEWLAAPEFSHFCLPASRGGTGARDASRPATAAPPATPRNLGEAVVMKWREESTARPDNLLKPIGLRRHRY